MKSSYLNLLFLSFTIIVVGSISANAQTEFAGTRWELIELNGKKIAGDRPFVEFNKNERRISGTTGCNRMFGQYELNRATIKVGDVGSTRMSCVQPRSMETETAFLKALESSTRLKRSGKTLTVYAEKKKILKFRKVASTGPKSITGN